MSKLKASQTIGQCFQMNDNQRWHPGATSMGTALIRKPSIWSEGPSSAALAEGKED
jgi:hypothetical protein